MKVFSLEIQSPESAPKRFRDIISFNGRDSSGRFGILAQAERRISALTFGLANFRHLSGQQKYLALPGAVLYFRNNELLIATQKFVVSSDFATITAALENEIRIVESMSVETRQSLRRLDEEILKRLSHLNWKVSP